MLLSFQMLATATPVMLRLSMQVSNASIGAVRLMGLTLPVCTSAVVVPPLAATTERAAFQFGVLRIDSLYLFVPLVTLICHPAFFRQVANYLAT